MRPLPVSEYLVSAFEHMSLELRLLETLSSCSPLGREEFACRLRFARTLGDLNLTDERCERALRPRLNRDFVRPLRRLRPGAITSETAIAAMLARRFNQSVQPGAPVARR